MAGSVGIPGTAIAAAGLLRLGRTPGDQGDR
jgi:hypothetical protein